MVPKVCTTVWTVVLTPLKSLKAIRGRMDKAERAEGLAAIEGEVALNERVVAVVARGAGNQKQGTVTPILPQSTTAKAQSPVADTTLAGPVQAVVLSAQVTSATTQSLTRGEAPAVTFYRFRFLPPELRMKIWRIFIRSGRRSIDFELVDTTMPKKRVIGQSYSNWTQTLSSEKYIRPLCAVPSCFFAVNYECRLVALEQHHLVSDGDELVINGEKAVKKEKGINKPWGPKALTDKPPVPKTLFYFRPVVDTLHFGEPLFTRQDWEWYDWNDLHDLVCVVREQVALFPDYLTLAKTNPLANPPTLANSSISTAAEAFTTPVAPPITHITVGPTHPVLAEEILVAVVDAFANRGLKHITLWLAGRSSRFSPGLRKMATDTLERSLLGMKLRWTGEGEAWEGEEWELETYNPDALVIEEVAEVTDAGERDVLEDIHRYNETIAAFEEGA